MIKKTFKEVREFNVAVDSFFKKDAKNINTKVGYAIKKISEIQIKNIINEYQTAHQELYYNEVEKKHVDHALTDKITGAILTTPKDSERPYLYDKVGLSAVIKAEKEFQGKAEALLETFDKKEFDIDPFYVSEMPKEPLTDNEKSAFTGFVIEPSK